MALKKGDSCPTFKLLNQHNELIDISTFIGTKLVVIYFYPKDETPGCTKEACAFRDEYEDFEALGCEVIGISSDSVSAHQKFAAKHRLNFQLLADTSKTARKLFGVPNDLFGLIPGRVTYIIDLDGKIQGIFNSQMNPVGHIAEAKKMVSALRNKL
jgi:peroxiredoxin Q/BCP